jgi:hypothetical protein
LGFDTQRRWRKRTALVAALAAPEYLYAFALPRLRKLLTKF